MMSVWLVEGYLAKPRQSIADALAKHHASSFNVILECELGPGTKADRDFRIVRARKAVSPCRKVGRNQRFRDLSGTCRDRMSAVIAHGCASYKSSPPNHEPSQTYWVAIPPKKTRRREPAPSPLIVRMM